MSKRQAIIIERGNGFPDVGDYVSDAEGELFRVVEIGDYITTGDARGNVVWAEVERAEWTDIAEDAEHSAIVDWEDDEKGVMDVTAEHLGVES